MSKAIPELRKRSEVKTKIGVREERRRKTTNKQEKKTPETKPNNNETQSLCTSQ